MEDLSRTTIKEMSRTSFTQASPHNLAESQYHEMGRITNQPTNPDLDNDVLIQPLILQISSNPRFIYPTFGQPDSEDCNLGITRKILQYIV